MATMIALPHRPKWTEWPAMSVALRFALAPVSIAFALGLARVFIYFHWPQPFTGLALCAIAITFWYGSTRSGIFATLIAWFAIISSNPKPLSPPVFFMTWCF
jgi:hypothetical protein